MKVRKINKFDKGHLQDHPHAQFVISNFDIYIYTILIAGDILLGFHQDRLKYTPPFPCFTSSSRSWAVLTPTDPKGT